MHFPQRACGLVVACKNSFKPCRLEEKQKFSFSSGVTGFQNRVVLSYSDPVYQVVHDAPFYAFISEHCIQRYLRQVFKWCILISSEYICT